MATMYYRPFTSEPIKDGEMPPHDAMESVLPEYQYIFKPDGKQVPGQVIGGTQALSSDYGQQSVQLLDYQMRELEKYRTAVHKMGQDILTLRQQVRELETQNSQLRRDLANYNDTTKLLMDSQDLDGLTKPELAARYVALKQKLSTQTNELRSYKERVQRLQNDMIKKNDAEKDMLRMSHAHKSQNELIQKLQDKANKVRRLEENIRKQEKVIEKQERLLSKSGKSAVEDSSHDVLLEENRRLRAEIEDLRDSGRRANSARDDEERLDLLERLEKSESRILSLEHQLTENARKWGKERSDLLIRLQEAEHGLGWSTLLQSYPRIEPSQVYQDPRSYSKPSRKARYEAKAQPVFYR